MLTSFLDTDVYQFTMLALAKQHSGNWVEYSFKCRNDINLSNIADSVRYQLSEYIKLRFTNNEVKYLNKICYDKLSFLYEYINNNVPFDENGIIVSIINNNLNIKVKGEYWTTLLLDIPVLSIVNETFNEQLYSRKELEDFEVKGDELLTSKIELLNNNPNIKLMEFGTRRRFSKEWHLHVLSRLISETDNILGTSNVELGKIFNINVLGTMGHSILQFYQGINHPLDSQIKCLYDWNRLWGNNFLIALSDIFPNNKFLKDFDEYLTKTYNGVRHDSGDPIKWGYEILNHYKKYGIDPKTKSMVFSNSLSIPDCIKLYEEFGNKINVSFGVGTNLTNDVGLNHTILNIVMKITSVNGRPVSKISNDIGKSMCENKKYQEYLLNALEEDVKNV
ncbi:MAG: nicotinate phosphoribosyltransferase [Candidatus Omnitrophica bacterium]|jgi:nicotinate phosphoribosyltransferase|nr:nicotinate phosphoribosyltransferase [Candidatus Omnitrophota bacterium]